MLIFCACSTANRHKCDDYTIRVGIGMREKGKGERVTGRLGERLYDSAGAYMAEGELCARERRETHTAWRSGAIGCLKLRRNQKHM